MQPQEIATSTYQNTHPPMGDVTSWLRSSTTNEQSQERVYRLLYQDLRSMALRRLRSEREGHTLSATALVNELFVKFAGSTAIEWENRTHFFAVAARAMRSILVDHARARNRKKRGGGARHVSFKEESFLSQQRAEELVRLDAALVELGKRNGRLSTVVDCRYFSGMSLQETACALEVSTMTVKRDWTKAKAFLIREMGRGLSEN